jgi:hypothetical protein
VEHVEVALEGVEVGGSEALQVPNRGHAHGGGEGRGGSYGGAPGPRLSHRRGQGGDQGRKLTNKTRGVAGLVICWKEEEDKDGVGACI